jgi:hypothetical protein
MNRRNLARLARRVMALIVIAATEIPAPGRVLFAQTAPKAAPPEPAPIDGGWPRAYNKQRRDAFRRQLSA